MNFYAIFPLISCSFLLINGFYLLRKNRNIPLYWIFGLTLGFLFFIEFSYLKIFISTSLTQALFWQKCSLAGLLFMPLVWTLLSFTLVKKNISESLKGKKWYLIILTGFTLWFLAFFSKDSLINSVQPLNGGYAFALGYMGRNLFIFLLLSLTAVLLNFENIYRAYKKTEKRKIKRFIKGVVVFLSSYIVLSSLAILFFYIDNRFTIIGSTALIIGMFLIPRSGSMYGFLPSQLSFSRQALYTSVTISIVGVYLIAIGLIVKLFMVFGVTLTSFLSFLGAFFAFFLFISLFFSFSLRERARIFIDRVFYKDKYDYRREWANISEELGAIVNINELIDKSKKIVKRIMLVDNVEVVLVNTKDSLFSRINSDFMEWLLRYGAPISREELKNKNLHLFNENKTFLERTGAHVIVTLNAKQQAFGVLILGEKGQGQVYSLEDIELLKVISRQVSIALLNAKLSEESIVSRQMENFNKLSSFLIHDLKNCVSMLSMVVQNAAANFDNPEFQKDILITISNTISKMNSLTQKLSTLPESLELTIKEYDINRLIDEMISKLKIEDRASIKLSRALDSVLKVKVDKEYMRKVILNLLMNAIEAMPEGGDLSVRTSFNNNTDSLNGKYVQIEVSDSGVGMSADFIERQLFRPFNSSKRKGIGIGLFQCKTIIEAHGGEILVDSILDKGTAFKINLPVNK